MDSRWLIVAALCDIGTADGKQYAAVTLDGDTSR